MPTLRGAYACLSVVDGTVGRARQVVTTTSGRREYGGFAASTVSAETVGGRRRSAGVVCAVAECQDGVGVAARLRQGAVFSVGSLPAGAGLAPIASENTHCRNLDVVSGWVALTSEG